MALAPKYPQTFTEIVQARIQAFDLSIKVGDAKAITVSYELLLYLL